MKKAVDSNDPFDIKVETYNALSFLVISIIIIVISPLLDSGYISDDAWASIKTAYPDLKSAYIGIYEQIVTAIKMSKHLDFGSAILGNLIFFITKQNLYAYKFFILSMVIGNVFLFRHFIFQLTQSRALSLMTIIPLPLLFQFRNYHDPILSFAGQQQVILATLLCSLIFLLGYLERGKSILLYLSVLFFFLCILISENAYLFFVFHVFIIYLKSEEKISKVLKLSLPYISISIFFIAVSAGLQYALPAHYLGTAPGFNFSIIAKTFSKQIISALPLSYFLLNSGNTIVHDYSYIYKFVISNLLFLLSIIFFLFYYFFSRLESQTLKSMPKYFPSFFLFLQFNYLIFNFNCNMASFFSGSRDINIFFKKISDRVNLGQRLPCGLHIILRSINLIGPCILPID